MKLRTIILIALIWTALKLAIVGGFTLLDNYHAPAGCTTDTECGCTDDCLE
jgi:hypothetical protein